MEALVRAAPEALRFDMGKKSVAAQFPEFRAWRDLLGPLFDLPAPEWVQKPKKVEKGLFSAQEEAEDAEENDSEESES